LADILEFDVAVKLEPVELTCGHTMYLSPTFLKRKREDYSNFWCSACGAVNAWPAPKQVAPPPPPTMGQKVVSLFRRSGNTDEQQPPTRGDSK